MMHIEVPVTLTDPGLQEKTGHDATRGRQTGDCGEPVFAGTKRSRHAEEKIAAAVNEYRDFPERSVYRIASKYGLPPSKLIQSARKAGVSGRKRGRQCRAQPDARTRRILDLCQFYAAAQVARQIGVSRQRISQVIARWNHLVPAAQLMPKAFPKGLDAPVRRKQPKEIVISFRLGATEVERVKQYLKTLGVPMDTSNSRACRIILLASLGGYNPGPNGLNLPAAIEG